MSIDGYKIRPAHPTDVPVLPSVERESLVLFAGLEEELGFGPQRPVEVNSVETLEAAREAGLLWVATDDRDAPVGFALVLEIDGSAHLDELDVLPTHGRHGVGSALLEAVCSGARASGYPAVTLSTFRDVPWNAPFYARRGFRVLDASELSPGLARIVEIERGIGLRTDLRVIMKRDIYG